MGLGGPELGKDIRAALEEVSAAQARVIETLTKEWESTATRYINEWNKMSFKDGVVKGLDGRPIQISSPHAILVYILQSDEAIMMQYALCFLYKWLTEGLGWKHGEEFRFVANVHDEYQCEVRKDCVQQYIPLANKSIEHAGNFLGIKCPHVGESDVGTTWADTH